MKFMFKDSELDLKVLNANQLIKLEEQFGSLAALSEGGGVSIKLCRCVLHLAVQAQVPDATEEAVGACMDIGTIKEAVALLMPAPKSPEERPLAQP